MESIVATRRTDGGFRVSLPPLKDRPRIIRRYAARGSGLTGRANIQAGGVGA